jgi:hypothetical protein
MTSNWQLETLEAYLPEPRDWLIYGGSFAAGLFLFLLVRKIIMDPNCE